MARNQLDPFVWTVASWRGFDVSAELPAVDSPVLHIHAAGDDLAGHTYEKKVNDVAAMRDGHLAWVRGPYTHGLPYENTAGFIDVAADFLDKVREQVREREREEVGEK